MNQGQQCQFCDLPFDTKVRIPRILNLCEHIICERCIKEHIKRGFPITCDQDGIVYNVKFDSLDNFKEDKKLIQTLQQGIVERDEEYDNSSDQNSVQISNNDILSEGKSDTMNYQDSSNLNIESQNDSQSLTNPLVKKLTLNSQDQFANRKNDDMDYDEYSVKNSLMHDFNPLQNNQLQMNSSISAISQNENDKLQIDPPEYQSESEESYNKQDYVNDKIDSFDSEENIPLNRSVNYCPQHKMNQEEICLECATRICAKCAVYGIHQNHNRKILPEKLFYEEIQKYKTDVEKWLNKIVQQDEFLKYEFIDNQFKKNSIQKQKELQDEIEQIYSRAFTQLQKQKDLLIANMKDRFQSKQKYLQEEINTQIQQSRPQMLQVQTELQSIKQAFKKKQNEKALFQIMRDKDDLNIKQNVKKIVQMQKQQFQKFQKKAQNFIENAKLVKNQDLDFDVAQLKTEALINDSVFVGSDGGFDEQDDEDDIIDLRDNNMETQQVNYVNTQNINRNQNGSFVNQSYYEQPPQQRRYNQVMPQPVDTYQMNKNQNMHQSMIDYRSNHYRHNSTIGFQANRNPHLNQSTFYHGQQSPMYDNFQQKQMQYSLIQDDYNSIRNSFNGSNSKNKVMRKNTTIEKNNDSDKGDIKINSELKRKIQAFLMSKSSTLDLNNNKIKDNDIFTLTSSLQKKTQLKNLLLKHNRFTDKAIQILCEELNGTNLRTIDVSNNNLSTKSLNYMLKFAEKNSKIKKIIFKDIPMKLKDKKMYQDFFTKLNVNFSIQLICKNLIQQLIIS